MIKKLLFVMCLFMAFESRAQVLYLETFDGVPGPTAGGAGTYAFPSNMTIFNVDNLVPDVNVSYVNDAWERREDFGFNVSDSCAFSTSWYNPVGVANDFMWTPAISLPSGQTINFSWQAKSYDPLYPDGYEVRIMTVAPTGGTGVIGNQLTTSTLLFSTAAEATSWVSHTLSLNAYGGLTVYLGFRNNSNNQFLLAVDDIKVEVINPYDASVNFGVKSEYTQIPVGQAILPLGGTVSNLGSSTLTNVNLIAEVYNSSNALVYTGSGTAVSSLIPGTSANFTLTPYVATIADNYTIKYHHTQSETDPVFSNDTFTVSQLVTNNVFARDNGLATGYIGIGAGNGGYVGQSFTLTAPAYLYAITTGYEIGYTGEPFTTVLWNTNALGVPQSVIASTDTSYYPNTNAIVATQPIYNGTMLLAPGTYVATAVEFDSTIAVMNMDSIFTLGKIWVNWPTTPLGGWGNVEAFGVTGFNKPLGIRLDLGSTMFPLSAENLTLSGKTAVRMNQLYWSNKELENTRYTYYLERSTDLTSWETIHSVSSLGGNQNAQYAFENNQFLTSKNYYRIKMQQEDKEMKYSGMVLLNQTGTAALVEVYPNPAKGSFSLHTNQFKNSSLHLIDIQGKIIRTQKISSENTSVSLEGILPGTYQVQLKTNTEILYSDKLFVE